MIKELSNVKKIQIATSLSKKSIKMSLILQQTIHWAGADL